MKKRGLLIIYLGILLILSNSTYSFLSCNVKNSCSGSETTILTMFSRNNAHAAISTYNNYDFKVCCSGVSGLGTSSGTLFLRLSSNNNAHVQKTSIGSYGITAYLSASGSVSCGYANDCSNYHTCLVSISADDNAHIGDCNAYETKVCCSAYEASETGLCDDGIDNDNDGESDYDNQDGRHGDKDCKVSITAISVSNTMPDENELINISCTTNVANINSVKAYIDNTECVWTDGVSKWKDNTAIFVGCNVGDSGTKNIKCTIDSTKSYQKGSDKTTTIEVLSSECNKYTTPESCPSSICEWRIKCDGYKWNGLAADSCVNKGASSTYQCNVYQPGETGNSCGATCDDSIGCEATICDNYCSGNTLYVRNDITNYCDTESSCSCSSASCETGTPHSCGTTSCDITKHLVGSCDNPCNEAGTKNDGTDASCGTCTPTFPEDCSCEDGYYDADGDPTNGCEYACGSVNEEVCNGLDDDCDNIIDEGCDDDNDNYCDNSMSISGTPSICSSGGGDCNDNNVNINPGVSEACNNIDDNCNNAIDEGCSCTPVGDTRNCGILEYVNMVLRHVQQLDGVIVMGALIQQMKYVMVKITIVIIVLMRILIMMIVDKNVVLEVLIGQETVAI
jgi:hypothetical protein